MLSNRPFLNDKLEEFLQTTCHRLQKQVWERKKEDFATWAETAMRKGARQAHAFIKQDDANYLRPYQNQPLAQRPAARRAYWKTYWQEEAPDRPATPAEEALKQEAIQEARTLKPISSAQIKATLQHMGKKKPGPDGWTVQELQQWPEQAISSLVWVYHQIEATGDWPAQATYTQIALLPKSLDNERPICLTSFFYRDCTCSRSGSTKSKTAAHGTKPCPKAQSLTSPSKGNSQQSSAEDYSFSKAPSSLTSSTYMTQWTDKD